MPYMHKKTFNITVSVGTPSFEYDSTPDYFHIDELIAVPVQILNRKGYLTACCCAGHPFDLSQDFPEPFKNASFIFERPCKSYISFEKEYSFSELPNGFVLTPGKLSIEKQHYKDGDFNYWKIVREIYGAMEQLYLWAMNLPDLTGGFQNAHADY